MKYIVFVVLFLFVVFRFYFLDRGFSDGDRVRITTKITTEPIVYEKQQYLKVKGLKVYLPKYPEIKYGDTVIVEGLVEKDKLKKPVLVEIKDEDNKLLYDFRNKLINFYKKALPEPYASLVSGVVLGSKQMPINFWEDLKRTGTAHIVVASGTNVTMVATFLISSLTYYFKRKIAVFMAIAGIFIYVILSGFDAPIVRAAIMGTIVFLGQEEGRVVNTFRVLIYTAFLMLLVKPEWINDLGFLLSFVATICLLLFQKKVNNYIFFVPKVLKEGLSTSIAAQIGVAPIIFVTFGQFNLLSPIINALVIWTVPYIMVLGALGGILGLIVPAIGRIILLFLFRILTFFVNILNIF